MPLAGGRPVSRAAGQQPINLSLRPPHHWPPRPSLSSCCPLPLPQLRRLVDDPLLAGTSHVVVDEVRVELRSEVLLELARWRVASTLDGQSTWPLRPMESDLRLLPSSHSGARALPGFGFLAGAGEGWIRREGGSALCCDADEGKTPSGGGGRGRSTMMPTGNRLKNNCSLLSPTLL